VKELQGRHGRTALVFAAAICRVGAVSNELLDALHNGRDLVSGRAAMRVLPPAMVSSDGGV
tara:strand:+ start:163 stop:345 length:183 start_codon:yes stop_codon:yes gene_type:complete